MADLVMKAHREALRCRRAIEKGSHPDFWMRRLESAIAELGHAKAILETRLALVQEQARLKGGG